jgi:uncharacterized protein
VLSLTVALAAETAGEGVRISALAPGPVNTGFHKRMGSEHAYYRTLVKLASQENVAAAAWRGFTFGRRIIVPGILNPVTAVALRVLPHRIVIPVIGWLLTPRGQR